MSGRTHWRLPECMERPQYKHFSIAGATYRVLDIPTSAEPLNRAEWNQAAFESLASCNSRRFSAVATAGIPSRERAGPGSDFSEEYFSDSSGSDAATSDSDLKLAEEEEMSEGDIEVQEEALDADFISSCSATQDGEQWRADIRIPRPLYRRLVGRTLSEGPLTASLDAIGARVGRGKMLAGRREEVVLPIWGSTERRVCLAVQKTQRLMTQMRCSARVTHFVSLPLSLPDMIARFEVYRHLVMASGYKTIDETLFINQEKLHITLLVLRLLTPAEVAAAAEALKSASAEIYDAVGTRTLRLHLKGNSCFSDDPSAVSVVFAPLYSSEGAEALAKTKAMLNTVTRVIAERLQAAGLLSRKELQQQYALGTQGEFDCIFHMTLLNETYRRRAVEKRQQEQTSENHGQSQEGSRQKPQQHQKRQHMQKRTFDASQLIQDMRGFDFGHVRVPSVQLNSISSTTEGAYECLAHVDLP
ncbi:kh domain-containing protein [Cyclospora cayetanensis]|nr:kh domain-containing protein [Cyclospora cayetanensis]